MAELDVAGHLRPLFNGVLGDLAGVGGDSAGDDDDPTDAGEHVIAEGRSPTRWYWRPSSTAATSEFVKVNEASVSLGG